MSGWTPCPKPTLHDVVRWQEPVWAAPNKPRGKPDQIGEQIVIAKITAAISDSFELEVQSVERLFLNEGAKDTARKISPGDKIRRKKASLKLGDCCKQ